MEINIPQIIATVLFKKALDIPVKNKKIYPLNFLSFSNKPYRLSISYLHRIAIKDTNSITKYLLVKSPKTGMYQPPGGVYKYYEKSILESLNARDHHAFHQKNDLRIELPERNITKFLRKFRKENWRESDYFREFKEELLDTDILDYTLFGNPKFRYVRRETSGKRFSKFFQCDEINFYDIIDVELERKQEEFLKELLKRTNSDYLFASEYQIKRRAYYPTENKDKPNLRITEHTERIL